MREGFEKLELTLDERMALRLMYPCTQQISEDELKRWHEIFDKEGIPKYKLVRKNSKPLNQS